MHNNNKIIIINSKNNSNNSNSNSNIYSNSYSNSNSNSNSNRVIFQQQNKKNISIDFNNEYNQETDCEEKPSSSNFKESINHGSKSGFVVIDRSIMQHPHAK
ncbi:hypothetical protein ACTFIV_001759 [Dictyostelium citrinum]